MELRENELHNYRKSSLYALPCEVAYFLFFGGVGGGGDNENDSIFDQSFSICSTCKWYPREHLAQEECVI